MIDVLNLVNVLLDECVEFRFVTHSFSDTFEVEPDVGIETKLSLQELRRSMCKVSDGHVMVETVNTHEKFTGERFQDSEKKFQPCLKK